MGNVFNCEQSNILYEKAYQDGYTLGLTEGYNDYCLQTSEPDEIKIFQDFIDEYVKLYTHYSPDNSTNARIRMIEIIDHIKRLMLNGYRFNSKTLLSCYPDIIQYQFKNDFLHLN